MINLEMAKIPKLSYTGHLSRKLDKLIKRNKAGDITLEELALKSLPILTKINDVNEKNLDILLAGIGRQEEELAELRELANLLQKSVQMYEAFIDYAGVRDKMESFIAQTLAQTMGSESSGQKNV